MNYFLLFAGFNWLRWFGVIQTDFFPHIQKTFIYLVNMQRNKTQNSTVLSSEFCCFTYFNIEKNIGSAILCKEIYFFFLYVTSLSLVC